MQLKQFYNIATKVSSRKKCYYFWWGIVQNVLSLCAKLRVCPLFEISTIDQPLFRGWGPPVRGGIVIWLARALRALGARQHVIGLSLAHPRWQTSEAVSNQGSIRAVAVWVGLLKWDYYFVMILGTIEQKETLKILTNIVMRRVRKMARDGLMSILRWANFVCASGLDRLTRLGMD